MALDRRADPCKLVREKMGRGQKPQGVQQQLRDITAPHVLADWLVLRYEKDQGLDWSRPKMVDWLWPGLLHGCSFYPARSVHVDSFFWRARHRALTAR